MVEHTSNTQQNNHEGETRRDFMVLSASALAAVGGAAAVWPFIDSMNPAADTLALASTEVDISSIQPGQSIRVMWRGKPVFIRHRTAKEIEEARKVAMADLPDPQEDVERVKEGKDEWLVMVGVCTHLGCVPLGEAGEYNGWFCPCHGSHYDTSGRIRKGPAPTNLPVPEYTFLSDSRIKIG
jgi:ubiquinol-cytochrome c reductase iron-sulfur subunit